MSNASDFIIENGVLTKYVGPGGDVVIPDGVTEIGEKAFAQCSSLTGITINNAVKVIAFSAFFWCRNLTKVQLGERVEKIDMFAFSFCDKLQEIDIPESVKSIQMQAFEGCGLRTIVIRGADVQIHATAFKENGIWYQIRAPKLPMEQIPKESKFQAAMGFLQLWAKGADVAPRVAEAYGAYIKKVKKKLIDEYILRYNKVCALQYILEQKLVKKTEIDGLIERTQKMNSVEMTALLMQYLNMEFGTGPQKALEREEAREQQEAEKATAARKQKEERKNPGNSIKKLWTVKKFPDGTCRLGGYKGILEELIVPEKVDDCDVVELGNRDNAFANEDGYKVLKKVVLPKSIRVIGRRFFAGTQLEQIEIPEGVQKIEKRLFALCLQLKSVKLPSTVTQIALDAFESCIHLETVNIPAHIQQIPKELFNSQAFSERHPHACIGLKHVFIQSKDTQIEKDAFYVDEGTQKLTIHAPAGSYAEAYAKEHNIPFVAE